MGDFMKVLLLLALASGLSACGMGESLSKNCRGSDIEMGCNAVFGSRDNDQDDVLATHEQQIETVEADNRRQQTEIDTATDTNNRQDTEIDNVERENRRQNGDIAGNTLDIIALDSRVTALENQLAIYIVLYNSLSTQVASIKAIVDTLPATNAAVKALEGQLVVLSTQLVAAQSKILQLEADIVKALTGDPIVEFIDPCGKSLLGLDEIIMRTRSGKLLAYTESGLQKFLSVLKIGGNYTTTDLQFCKFNVNAEGKVCDGKVCQ